MGIVMNQMALIRGAATLDARFVASILVSAPIRSRCRNNKKMLAPEEHLHYPISGSLNGQKHRSYNTYETIFSSIAV